jgi:hypothetical protein
LQILPSHRLWQVQELQTPQAQADLLSEVITV